LIQTAALVVVVVLLGVATIVHSAGLPSLQEYLSTRPD
jgi:hypothetical protein